MEKSTNLNGAEILIRSLIAENVKIIFGYQGAAIIPAYDCLYDRKEIRHIMVRHEQGAAHAAEGYARASGKAGVVMVTSGPAVTNLITGIADAMADSTPIVIITGQVFSSLLGTDAFQEVDVLGITQPITKWNCQIQKAEELAPAIARAFYIAQSGRPGPVVIDITKDALLGTCPYSYQPCKSIRSYVPYPEKDKEQLLSAAQLINKAKKPLVVFGQGVILGNAEEELLAFIEKADLPAASTLLGLSAIPSNHPLYKGMVGMHGNISPNIKTNECDVLVAIGMRFDDRVTASLSNYARQAKIIHFDIDNSEFDKNVKSAIKIHGNAKETLKAILPLIQENKHSSWINDFSLCDQIEYNKIIRNDLYPAEGALKMGEIVRKISDMTHQNAILVTDVGQNQMFAARYFQYNQSRSMITSGGLGTMGFGLPAAIGAKLGAPNRTVCLVCGDGGFQMTIQELGTIMQSKLDIKIVLFNNNYLGMVRQWQQLFLNCRYAETEMENPDFPAITKAYGIKSKRITRRDEADLAIQEMLSHKGCYFLEVVVEEKELVFPMIQAGGAITDIILNENEKYMDISE
ncbi:MAG: biosynthetic-type acetolactate synthase large subunit [Bacteroidales bacterium]|nr:biosynthetic-type acetolactate synthase large subunit [Bacteroidales bacterium]